MTIRQKQQRKAKLKKLRQRYAAAKDTIEKEQIWQKVVKIAPWLTKEQFLAPLKQAAK